MAIGTARWFDDAKGFGFFALEYRAEVFFAHFPAISTDGFKSPKRSLKVSYEVTQSLKGKQSSNIQAIYLLLLQLLHPLKMLTRGIYGYYRY